MAHQIAYSVAGGSWSDLSALKAAGFIDAHFVSDTGSYNQGGLTGASFVAAANAAGMSPVLNNGNDGQPGWNGSEDYYVTVKAMGFHAAGGESETAQEVLACMKYLPFMTYGGEYGGCAGLSNIWTHGSPGPSGFGQLAYLESYCMPANLCASAVVEAMVKAHDVGCKEVGLMIGAWMTTSGGITSAQPYIDIIASFEKQTGAPCAGVCLWGGRAYSMNQNYVLGNNPGIIKGIQAVWPPNMTVLKDRLGGVSGNPTVTGTKKISLGISTTKSWKDAMDAAKGATVYLTGKSGYADSAGNWTTGANQQKLSLWSTYKNASGTSITAQVGDAFWPRADGGFTREVIRNELGAVEYKVGLVP